MLRLEGATTLNRTTPSLTTFRIAGYVNLNIELYAQHDEIQYNDTHHNGIPHNDFSL
jgi:hypothetical protein